MPSVVIVVPMYKATLSGDEKASLSCCFSVLSDYKIIFAAPESADLDAITGAFVPFRVERFRDSYFTDKIAYNSLMLSYGFYERFLEWDYMLLYQLDAWVFRDELMLWAEKNYDYIGAPWPLRPIYSNPIYKICSAVKTMSVPKRVREDGRHAMRGKVGNGGFSLRRNGKICELLRANESRVAYYIENSALPRYYEDVFFAVEAPLLDRDFRIPDMEEALAFAFDKYPGLCYGLNGNKLPFGCHGFNKRKNRSFWKGFIPME